MRREKRNVGVPGGTAVERYGPMPQRHGTRKEKKIKESPPEEQLEIGAQEKTGHD